MVELVDTKDLKSFDHCGRVGSSPTPGTNAEVAQLVEHNLAKVGVAGPSPVFRSHKALFLEGFFRSPRSFSEGESGSGAKVGSRSFSRNTHKVYLNSISEPHGGVALPDNLSQ